MKNPEESIEKVLSGLGNTEPPSGLEQRVLRSLEQGVRKPSFWPRWKIMPGARVPRLALQGAVVVAVLVAGVSFFLHRNAFSPSRADLQPAPKRGPELATDTPPPPDVAEVQPSRISPYHGAKSVHSLHISARQINLPAPPRPLTEEEKLLLQIAQEGNADQIAMLNPEARAQDKAQHDAEFQKFFASPDITQN